MHNYFDPSIGLIRQWHQNEQLQKATINSDTDIFSLDLSCQTNVAEIYKSYVGLGTGGISMTTDVSI